MVPTWLRNGKDAVRLMPGPEFWILVLLLVIVLLVVIAWGDGDDHEEPTLDVQNHRGDKDDTWTSP